jgi:prepilin-type N-terminal cleavage/methylation domain-containing protein
MKNKRGFSLVEVLVASFIVAIILGAASTSFLNLAPKYRLKSAVREINSRLNYARYKSIFEGVKVRVKFDQHSYIIETYDEEKNEWKREREYFLRGVTLQANNSPTFHPVGTVSNLASIYISNSWGKHKITLAISGRIKIAQI